MPPPRKYQDPLKKTVCIPEPQPPIRSVPVSKLVGSRSHGPKEEPRTLVPTEPKLVSTIPRGPAQNARDALKSGWSNLGRRALDWLQEGERFEGLLAESKLKEIAVFMGIATEKVLLLEGQPTQIIAQSQHQKLDQVAQALQEVMKQRGIGQEVKLTERTATITLDAPRSAQ